MRRPRHLLRLAVAIVLATLWPAAHGTPVRAECSVREIDAQGDGLVDEVVLENSWHRITFQPAVGGTVSSWVFKPLDKEFTSPSDVRAVFSDEVAEASAPSHRVPLRHRYTHEIIEQSPQAVQLVMHAALPPLPSQPGAVRLELRRTYAMRADSPLVDVSLEVKNTGAEPLPFAAMAVHWVWVAGESSYYFCPGDMGTIVDVDELTGMPSHANGSQSPVAAWSGFISRTSKLGLAFVMEERYLDALENWLSSREASAIQWAYREQDIPAGGSWKTDYRIYPLQDLDALDIATDAVAAGVTVGAGAGLGKDVAASLEAGTKIPVVVEVTGPRPVRATVEVGCRRWDQQGPVVALGSHEIAVEPLRASRLELSCTPHEAGTYVLDVTIRGPEGTLARFEKPFNVGESTAVYVAPKSQVVKVGRPRIGEYMIDPPLPDYCGRFDRSWQTPHVPWGRPHQRGTVPMLFVTRANYTLSHLREICERGDLDVDLALVAKSAGGKPYPYQRKLLGELSLALSNDKYRVAFFAGQKWQAGFTPALRRHIFARIRQGLGAVILADPRAKPGDPENGDLAAFLAEGTEVDPTPLVSALPFAPPALRMWEVGKGRVVVVEGAEGFYESMHSTGSLGDWKPATFTPHVPCWEYGYGLLVRAIYWAARRESPIVVRSVAHTPAAITIATENTSGKAQPAVIAVKVLDRFNAERAAATIKADVPPGAGQLVIPLAADLAAGPHLADVILRDAAGASLGWGSVALDMPGDVSITLAMDRATSGYRPGDPITAVATIVKTATGPSAVTMEFTAVDAHGRLAFQATRDVTLEGAKTRIEQPVDPLRRVTVLHDLNVAVRTGSKTLCRDRHTFYVFHDRQPVYDDFKIGIYGTLAYDPLSASTARTLRDLGVDEIYAYGDGGSARETAYRNGFFLVARQNPANELRPRGGPIPSKVDTDTLVVEPPLTDPDTFARMEETMRKHVRSATENAGIDLYLLGDEWGWNAEFDHHPDTLARFREWLRDRYPSLAALNAQWGSRFDDWKDVVPTRGDAVTKGGQPANVSSWYDFRHYMSTVWTEYVRRPYEAAKSVNPRAEVGFEGSYATSVKIGNDIMACLPYTKVTARYNSMLEEWYRSVDPPIIHGQYGGYGLDAATPKARFFPWRSLLHGGNWVFYYMLKDQSAPYQMIIDFDGSPHGAYPALAREEWADIKGGIGKLFIESRFVDDGIALPYDLASLYCGDLLGVDHRGGLFRHKSIVQELGFQHSTLTTERIADGDLVRRGYRLLLLPQTPCLSDATVAAIRAFVEAGGTVVADSAAGIRDEHGKLRVGSGLDDLFGIDRSGVTGEPREQTVEFGPEAPPPLAGLQSRLKPLEMGLRASSGTAAGRYADGTAALVVKTVGKGRAIYTNIDVGAYATSTGGGAAGEVTMETGGEAAFVRAIRQLYASLLGQAGLTRRVTVSHEGSPLVGGETFYFGETGDAPLYVGTLIDSPAPRPVEVKFAKVAHLYDVRDGAYHGFTDRFADEFRPGRVQIYAALPYRVAGVEARVEPPAAGGRFAAGTDVRLTAAVRTDGAAAVKHVLRVEVFHPDGTPAPEYTANHRADGGKLDISIPLELNPPAGTWKVVVTDVVSRCRAEVGFDVASGAADRAPAGDAGIRIEPLGPLVSRCSLPGEAAADGMFPAHPSGIQLAADRFMVVYATRGIRCHDDDGSIVYQIRAEGFDGPVLHEGFLARRIDNWDPFGNGSAYVKLLRHPVAFGVPKGAVIGGLPAAHANLFAACWAVQAPGPLDRETGTYAYDREVAERSIFIEWTQFRLNDAGDDIEILEPPGLMRQQGHESGKAFCSHADAVTINQSLVAPVPYGPSCLEWAVANHLSTGIAACKFRFDPARGRYAWVETGRAVPSEPGYDFSEGELAPVADGWVVGIRARRRNAAKPDWSGSTSRDRGDTAWVKTPDPFREMPSAVVVHDPKREAPMTVFRCADGVLRMFSGDLAHSPHRMRRDPLYAWDVDPRDFTVSRRQIVLDSIAAGIFAADGPQRAVDFACVFPHTGGRSQLLAHRVLLYRYRAGVVPGAPAVTPEELDTFGIHYARITYPEPQRATWTFGS